MVKSLEKNDKKLIIALILSSCIVAGFFTFLYIDINQKLESLSSTSGVFTPLTISPGEIYDKTTESVVLIASRKNFSESMTTQSKCSGFIYDDEGHVITVNSSIADADEIRVIFANGTEVKAKVIGFDEYSNLAVLKINENLSVTQQPLKFETSGKLHLTERIYIVGKLFGDENSMIPGEVNRLRCALWFKDEFPIVDVIQFSATICPETLGAPLLNSKGNVVGIAIKMAEKGNISSVGYALSSEMIKRIVPSIIKMGNYTHPWLEGVRGVDLTQQIAEKMNVNLTRGFLVTHIDAKVNGSLHAGNRTVTIDGKNITVGGDIIIKINEREVRGFYDIVDYLEKYKYKNIGKNVTLTIFRNGKIMDIKWKIGKVEARILDN